MARVTTMTDDAHLDEPVESIEPRLRRLEHAIAALGDTQLMEDRVVERVVRRIEPTANGGMLSGAAKLFKGRAQPPKPADGETETATTSDSTAKPAPEPPHRSGWLIPEFIQEVRWMFRMFGDYRYRLSWTGWVVPIACLVVAILSWLLIGRGLPLVGDIIDRIVNILLVVIAYKSLSREVQRYHQMRGLR